MFKHWRAIVGLLFFLQPAWGFVKWGLDWAGRIDLITSHLHDLKVQAVFDFIQNPPAWSFFPSVGIGLLLIWWDVRRKEAAELDLNQKLLIGFYLGCAVLFISVWFTAWFVSLPVNAAPIPITPAAVAPATPPKPPPPALWVTSEEIETQHKQGRTLLVFSPQELASLSARGQNLKAYETKWIKVDYPVANLPVIETIEKKDYYLVYVTIDVSPYFAGNRYLAAYFDPKRWGDLPLSLRIASKLRAACQFAGFDHRVVNGYYTDAMIGYDCDLL
jgi:hypothetical protein